MNVSEMPAGRELDALVAEKVMGIDRWEIYDCDMVGSPSDNYQEWIREENVLFYSTDIAAAWQVEKKIDELDLRHKYITALICIVSTNTKEDYTVTMNWLKMTSGFAWLMVHATPEQRCRAALKAVME